MKFAEVPIGTLFRFDCRGLPRRLAQSEALGPFRKVAEDGAVHISDQRGVKWYVAPTINVARVQHQNEARDSSISP